MGTEEPVQKKIKPEPQVESTSQTNIGYLKCAPVSIQDVSTTLLRLEGRMDVLQNKLDTILRLISELINDED